MNNFRQKFSEFMYGRYGNDKLNFALAILWVVLSVFTIFIHNLVFSLIAYVPIILFIYRFLSKNIYKRQKENTKFLELAQKAKFFFADFKQWWFKVERWFNLQKRKFTDRKTHRYIKCPHCHSSIRVPFKKGKHTLTCPRCRKDFETNIRF